MYKIIRFSISLDILELCGDHEWIKIATGSASLCILL